MKRFISAVILVFVLAGSSFAQNDKSKVIQDIKSEAAKNPQTLVYTSYLADVIGPRLTWSPGFFKAVDWCVKSLRELGLENAHAEEWSPEGKGWELKNAALLQSAPYVSTPSFAVKPWSPSTKGTVKGKAVYLDAATEADLEKYKGKLKGAIVLISLLPNPKIGYNPLVTRYAETDIQKFESAQALTDEQKKKAKEDADTQLKNQLKALSLVNKKIEFCIKEGAALTVEYSPRAYGFLNSFGALVPKELTGIDDYVAGASSPNAPATIPQIVVALELYDTFIRIIKNGQDVNLEINIDAKETGIKKGKSVFAEIPGSDLKNEIVLIGGHIDTQGPSIGATDNAVGAAVCMEAMRILKQIGIKPRRTIRIALWGGEEEGLYGSTAYVKEHFSNSSSGEKCYMYFNTDNGAGRFRGLYLEERTDLLPLFKNWFSLIDMKLVTCISSTANTDHVPFVEKGIAGFQFIQDLLDYFRIYHTNMDRMERIPAEDVRDNAIIMASLAYLAAME